MIVKLTSDIVLLFQAMFTIHGLYHVKYGNNDYDISKEIALTLWVMVVILESSCGSTGIMRAVPGTDKPGDKR